VWGEVGEGGQSLRVLGPPIPRPSEAEEAEHHHETLVVVHVGIGEFHAPALLLKLNAVRRLHVLLVELVPPPDEGEVDGVRQLRLEVEVYLLEGVLGVPVADGRRVAPAGL